MFDFFLGPHVDDPLPHLDDLWCGDFACLHIVSQRIGVNAKLFSCLCRRKSLHPPLSSEIGCDLSNAKYAAYVTNTDDGEHDAPSPKGERA